MIKNVILDVGNVLVDYCWEKHLAPLDFRGHCRACAEGDCAERRLGRV